MQEEISTLADFIRAGDSLGIILRRVREWRDREKSRREDASGIADRASVFGQEPLKGQVFSIEVLEKPIAIESSAERVVVTVDRAGCSQALYTNAGKKSLIRRTLPSDSHRSSARDDDSKLHRRFTGHVEGRYRSRTPNLRWTSGGVFSSVCWKGEQWTPFFYRDIAPFGWNVALGASEQPDNPDSPWTVIVREFLEEMLVVSSFKSEEQGYRPFDIRANDGLAGPEGVKQVEAAADFSAHHRNQRFFLDGLDLKKRSEPVVAEPQHTSVVLEVLDGATRVTSPDVLVAVSPEELGIEIAAVLKYKLEDDDMLLDGEMIHPPGSKNPQLVRMPVAMISHRYLERAAEKWKALEYDDAELPSVLGPAFEPGEAHLFCFDVERRLELADEGNEWEKESYGRWRNTDAGRRLAHAAATQDFQNLPTTFTPASAKLSTYWWLRASHD